MKKIEFINLEMAVNHAKKYGGWIFHNADENIAIWYDAFIYTMTDVLIDSPCTGMIAVWSEFRI